MIGLVNVTCIVYLDNILIFLEDSAKYTLYVRKVLERLRTYKLYANLKKCEFETTSIEFLGYIIGIEDVSIDPSRVEAIQD